MQNIISIKSLIKLRKENPWSVKNMNETATLATRAAGLVCRYALVTLFEW